MGVRDCLWYIHKTKYVKQPESKNILDKYLDGTASDQEQHAIINYYDGLQEKELIWNTQEMGNQNELQERILNKINNRIDNHQKFKIKNIHWLTIAASLFMIIALGSYFLVHTNDVMPEQEQVSLKPGSNKATLTLANGKQIILNETENGEIARQDHTVITKTADGKLVYDELASPNEAAEVSTAFNTIKIPRGGQYEVILPDGTKVWLNAESSLSYPPKFHSKERIVDLKGEAYFEVSKDKARPFIVHTTNQKVEVLGTHFNITAYDDDPSVKTTLLEGSVKVYPSESQNAKLLKPGQRSVLTAQSFIIENADLEEAIAWKNGIFLFNNENIKTALQKFARWYDVEIIYKGDFSDINFGGSFSRFANLNESINVLESTNKLKCKIVGRRIYIMR